MIAFILAFLRKESSVGILLMVATVLAMALANSPLHWLYDYFLDTPVEVRVGRQLHIDKPLLLWINDGLMAIFFLLIGLEVKREVLGGQLSTRAQIALPGVAAVGGMLAPALIYVFLNIGDSVALNGWAIPAATDIAFALGVLALLGDRVPSSLKIFLLALAIMDDLGAIVIIALFYTGDLSISMLLLALACLGALAAMNRLKVSHITPYMWVGALLWIFVLKSGVHATLAGVALAFAIPLGDPKDPDKSPLLYLEHELHPWVSYLILPVFAFANAGIPLKGMGMGDLFHPVPWRLWLFNGRHQIGNCENARECRLATSCRSRCFVWHRLHHEPFYWRPCFSTYWWRSNDISHNPSNWHFIRFVDLGDFRIRYSPFEQ